MKKFLVILGLCLVLCMMCSVALASPGSGGAAGDDDIDSEFEGVSYDDPTRVHEIEIDETTMHTVSNPVIVKEATCTEKAIVRFDCDSDPTHFHEVLMVLYPYGHDFVFDHINTDFVPTDKYCYEVTLKCTVCGETTTRRYGHIWSSEYDKWTDAEKAAYKPWDYSLASQGNDNFAWGKVTKEPTCTTAGEAVDFCPRCGYENPYVLPRVIEPIAHVFGYCVNVKPTCQQNGSYYIGCIYCGVKLDNIAIRTATDGMGNLLYSAAIAKFGPQLDNITLTVAGVNNIIYTKGGFANWKPLTDEEIADGVQFDGHDWDNWVTETPATCYGPESQVRWCKICGDKQHRDVGDPLDPVYKITSYSRLDSCYKVEVQIACALCNGLEKDGYCPHPTYFTVFENNVAYPTDATAPYDGSTKTLKELLGADCPVGNAHVEAHVYKYEKDYKAGHKDPTCEEKGYDCYYCIYETTKGAGHEHPLGFQYIDALGHDWGDWVERYAPGEGDNEYGYWLRECEREIKKYKDFDLNTMTASVKDWTCPKTDERISQYKPEEMGCSAGHTWTILKTVPATCTTAGSQDKLCSVCGKTETSPLPPTGHNYKEEIVAEATCTAEGKLLKTCTVCGNLTAQAIPKKDHKEVAMPEVAPTCHTTGLTGGTWCENCHKIFTEQEVVPADENMHDWDKEVITAATCTKEGVEIWTCKVCNKVQKVTPEKLAHVEDAGTVTKEATLTEKGEKTYKCVNCGAVVRTEPIDFTPATTPAYKLEDMAYGSNKITGKVTHDPATVEAPKLYARVTVFLVGGTYAVFADIIEDGTIDMEVHGTVLAVSVELTGSKNVVPGADMVVYDSWGEYYQN